MKTFTSCGLVWYPWPADCKCPCEPDQHVRILTIEERSGEEKYDNEHEPAGLWWWGSRKYAGWYTVNPDGTEITPSPSPSRPRVLRRRFPLARGVRPTWK